jgi:Na+-translocating ferredoxin:NAD+ oxidoreductase RnfG subunit
VSQVAPDTIFQLNGSTLAGIGAIMGALSGGITFLFRLLIASKDQQLKDRDEQMDQLLADRNYWRDMAIRMMEPAEKAIAMAEDITRDARRGGTRTR